METESIYVDKMTVRVVSDVADYIDDLVSRAKSRNRRRRGVSKELVLNGLLRIVSTLPRDEVDRRLDSAILRLRREMEDIPEPPAPGADPAEQPWVIGQPEPKPEQPSPEAPRKRIVLEVKESPPEDVGVFLPRKTVKRKPKP